MLGLHPGQHIYARILDDSGMMVQRAHTPLSNSESTGYVDILIKYPILFLQCHICANASVGLSPVQSVFEWRKMLVLRYKGDLDSGL